MTDDEALERAAREAERTVDAIRPLLAGKGPEIQGAVIAELAAIFFAGHVLAEEREATRKDWLTLVDKLIALYEIDR